MNFSKLFLFVSLAGIGSTSLTMNPNFYAENKETVDDCVRGFVGGFINKVVADNFQFNFKESSKVNSRNLYLRSMFGLVGAANIIFPVDTTDKKLETLKRITIRAIVASLGYATKGFISTL